MSEPKKWDDYIRPYDDNPLSTGDFVIFKDPTDANRPWIIDRGVWSDWGCGDLDDAERPPISDDTDISYWEAVSWCAKTLEEAIEIARSEHNDDPDYIVNEKGLQHPGGSRIFLGVGPNPNYYTLRILEQLTNEDCWQKKPPFQLLRVEE